MFFKYTNINSNIKILIYKKFDIKINITYHNNNCSKHFFFFSSIYNHYFFLIFSHCFLQNVIGTSNWWSSTETELFFQSPTMVGFILNRVWNEYYFFHYHSTPYAFSVFSFLLLNTKFFSFISLPTKQQQDIFVQHSRVLFVVLFRGKCCAYFLCTLFYFSCYFFHRRKENFDIYTFINIISIVYFWFILYIHYDAVRQS